MSLVDNRPHTSFCNNSSLWHLFHCKYKPGLFVSHLPYLAETPLANHIQIFIVFLLHEICSRIKPCFILKCTSANLPNTILLSLLILVLVLEIPGLADLSQGFDLLGRLIRLWVFELLTESTLVSVYVSAPLALVALEVLITVCTDYDRMSANMDCFVLA